MGQVIQLIDSNTKENVNYEETTVWYDNTPMDDSKVDNYIYRKTDGKYYQLALPAFGESLLRKNTMQEMRSISISEVVLLKMGYYKGIELHGYYTKDDTPASIIYIVSNSNDPDDGGSIIRIGDIVMEHIFVESLNTVYFGLSTIGGNTPEQNRLVLQKSFDAALKYKVKNIIINEGEHLVTGGGIIYRVPNSFLYFHGSLKLADNSNEGEVQFITYTAGNITVYNQMFDGNRDNNTPVSERGVQCNWACYGDAADITFIGGWSKNSLQSHLHSIAQNLTVDSMLLENAGEHGMYLTLPQNSPRDIVTVKNCTIRGWGLLHEGGALSIRDYRLALINECVFDPTDKPKPENCSIAHSVLNHRSVIGNEQRKHIYTNCTFLSGTGITTGISAGLVSNPDTTIAQQVERGNGIYINGGTTEVTSMQGVVKVENMKIRPTANNFTGMTRLARQYVNCDIHRLAYIRPNLQFVRFEECRFHREDGFTGGIGIDLNQSETPDGAKVEVLKCDFYDFTLPSGIIRKNNKSSIVVKDCRTYRCGSARLVTITGASKDIVMNNISDTTELRVSIDRAPLCYSGNTFARDSGTTEERPLSSNIFVGFQYFDITLGKIIYWDGTGWVIVIS